MSRFAIERARQVHQRHPMLGFPVDMERLAHAEGCECVYWPFLEPVEEVKCGRWIGIADRLPREEQRCLIAHAVAHHLMHSGNQLLFHGWMLLYRNKQEQEADCCAAHILMPEEELRRCGHRTIVEIAEHFGVTEKMADLRMTDYATSDERERWQWEIAS